MTGPREAAAIILASQARQQCFCLQVDGTASCECRAPVTREQIGRLRAFVSLRPDWAVAYSELAGEWMAVRHASLPPGQDPIGTWLLDPFSVPPAADLHHAADLGSLLDGLQAPALALFS
jgi:hypothetical protein